MHLPHPSAFELTPNDLRVLRSRRVADYFSISPEAADQTASAEELAYPEEERARLIADFERLLRHRRGLQGLARAAQFAGWWEANRETYLTRPVMANYRRAGTTLGEFLDDLHLHFMSLESRRRSARKSFQFFSRLTKNRATLTIALSIMFILSRSAGFVWNLVVLGPGVQMVNSYTKPVITPLAETAQQKGSTDLGRVASVIQAWMTSGESMREVREGLRQTTEKFRKSGFRGLTPEETNRKWAEFEGRYFELFMSYNRTLPTHLRDGRAFFRDWMIYTQTALASNIATFDTQYWIHHREYEQARTAADRRRHQAGMEGAESRIAGALAAWKIYEFMYPEFSRETSRSPARAGLMSSYKAYIKTMRFDLYVDQFVGRMEEVLKDMDADILLRDEVARVSGRGPAAKPLGTDRVTASQAQAQPTAPADAFDKR